jgi:SAM-dependent methyltransferase
MSIRAALLRLHWLLSAQLGVDLIKTFRALPGVPRYVRDLFRFRAGYAGRLELLPCLHERYEEAGATKSEYFWQDLLVARKIFTAKPEKHVDIGSRVDGFVAHVASFREIEVFDIRPITTSIPGVTFKQADLMNPAMTITDYCDSLSCLHALEHFGLGRYGDPIDPKGYEPGIRNMARILRPHGIFYLSVPVGIERVEFNAHRVFDPNTIVAVAEGNQLMLHEFALFTSDGGWVEMDATKETLIAVGKKRYGLGIFTFIKKQAY